MTTLANPTQIKCGNCHRYHETVSQVRDCHFPPAPAPAPAPAPVEHVELITPRQLAYVTDLGADPEAAKHYTKSYASTKIKQLLAERDAAKAAPEPVIDHRTQAPNRSQTIIPLDMISALGKGYYASRADSTDAYTFFRVSEPKSGRWAGVKKIQTQHGENYELCMVMWPSGSITFYNKAVENDLLLVAVDQVGTAMNYAEEIGRCCRCNKELTDPRSRWYGIGPECEQYRPQIITTIDDTKGHWYPGRDD